MIRIFPLSIYFIYIYNNILLSKQDQLSRKHFPEEENICNPTVFRVKNHWRRSGIIIRKLNDQARDSADILLVIATCGLCIPFLSCFRTVEMGREREREKLDRFYLDPSFLLEKSWGTIHRRIAYGKLYLTIFNPFLQGSSARVKRKWLGGPWRR